MASIVLPHEDMTAQETQGDPSIEPLCQLSGVSRAGFYRFGEVCAEIAASPVQVTLTTKALRLTVTLDGFRMVWALPDGTIFARDRETQPYFLGQKNHAFRHAMARVPSDRHFGLGDKTGPLDLTGRRLRTQNRDRSIDSRGSRAGCRGRRGGSPVSQRLRPVAWPAPA